MPRDTFIPLPSDLDPASPDFVATLNDRFRRLADQLQAQARAVSTAAAGSLSGSAGRPVIGTAGAPKLLAPGDTLDLTGAILTAPNGVIGLSGTVQVRNSAGTGITTLHLSDGLITSVT